MNVCADGPIWGGNGLPLKEVDLKTIATYKKAIHQDVTKITDSSAIKFWVYKDIELPDDHGKKQKISAFVALVEDTGIRNFMRGKKLLCSGTCRLEAGKVEFTPLKGKVPYTKLKVTLPLFLGKPLHLPANAEVEEEGEGIEDDAEEQSGGVPSAPVTPPPPQGANLAATWATLLKECQAAMAANPARKDALTQAASSIPDLIKANNVAEATAKMEALKALLQAPPPPVPPPPPQGANLAATWATLLKECQAAVAANPARKDALMHAASSIPDLIKANNVAEATAKMEALKALLQAPPPPAPPPPPGAGANLGAMWADLLKQCQAAVAANPARKDALQHAAAGIPDLIKANNVKDATAKMEALKALLHAPPPPPPPQQGSNLVATWNALLKECQAAVAADPTRKEALQHAAAGIPDLIKSNPAEAKKRLDALEALLAAPSTHPTDPAAKAFEERFDSFEKRLLEAFKNPAADAGSLRAAIAFAKEKGEAGDFAAGGKALDRLESLLANLPEPGTSGSGTPYKGIVQYRKALLEFDTAKKTVAAQVAALSKAVADLSPDYEDLADDIEERLSDLNEEIGDAIDDAMSFSENEESPVTDAVKASIQKYLNEVAASPLVKRADSNPFGVNMSIEKTLAAALQRVRQSLPVPA